MFLCFLVLVSSLLVLVAVVLTAVLFAVNSGLRIGYANETKTVHVVEHAITDTEINVGQNTSDALGNQLVFHNPVYDAADKNQVGHDNGNCVRTVVGQVWECYWTTFLAGGQLTVEGPFYDNGTDSMLAITGGTGNYREAHGQMLLHARGNPVGSEYNFIFYLN